MKLPKQNEKQNEIQNIQDNRKQLIGQIYDDIISNVKFQETTIGSKHRLIEIGENASSLEVADAIRLSSNNFV